MTDRNAALDALQGWLVLAPLFYLALPAPWGPLTDAPDPLSIGVGIAGLGAIPPVLLVCLRLWRGSAGAPLSFPFPFGFPLLLATFALAAYRLPDAVDEFNAWRAVVGLGAAVGYYVAGATLGMSGCRVLLRGLPIVALMALAGTIGSEGGVGVIGNTGDLSELALPGAVLGAGAFLTAESGLGFIGFATLFLYAAWVGLVPVYAGAAALGVAFVCALGASVVAHGGGEHGRSAAARRARLLAVATLVAGVAMLIADPVRSALGTDTGASRGVPGESVETRTTTGGIEFRRLAWATIPDVLEDHGVTGVGPGQFQAAYPPYRSAREIELSSFERAQPTPIEVEHAHNDPLTALVEYGWLGGGTFVLFLLVIGWRSLRSIASERRVRRDFGLASLALLAVALVNSPLLYGVAAPIVAFAAFGIVSSTGLVPVDTRRFGDAVPPLLAAIGLLVLSPRALGYFEYGREMARVREAFVEVDGRERLDAARLMPILEAALEHEPMAPEALEKRAEILRADPSHGAGETRAAHERWLATRPHSLAAHLALGRIEAEAGRFDRARTHFDAAHAVDGTSPLVLRNRVRVAFDGRDLEGFRGALDDLAECGRLEPELVDAYLRESFLTARLEFAGVALERLPSGSPLATLDVADANALHAAAKAARTKGDTSHAEALSAGYYTLIAADDLTHDSLAQARISARLAFQKARNEGADTAATRLRLAAATAAAGEVEDARSILEEGLIHPIEWRALPDRFRNALASAGLTRTSAVLRSD